jgi:alkylation response protein AidB-like acyl-CoA dehydrogenase
MPVYDAPLADYRFLLEEVFDIGSEPGLGGDDGGIDVGTGIGTDIGPGFDAGSGLTTKERGRLGSSLLDVDLVMQILAEAGRFASEVILPLDAAADRPGCVFDAGTVRTAPGFVRAYAQLCEGGWPSLSGDPAWGGQGMPRVVQAAVQEMFASGSLAFQMFASINQCAHDCLSRAASTELQRQWLPSLVDGSVLATMCMSEPQAGSDLGLLTTKATPQDDGSYAVSGTKIFASGAEHDLTTDILHLVLARIAGSPAGTRGLSLFVVPKRLENGAPNAVRCLGIEHKLGLHGSPTCVMNFDGARGFIVGEPDRGLAAMFHMMNAARLSTGVQAVGLSEAAWQQADAYARERRQGRAGGRGGAAVNESPVMAAPASGSTSPDGTKAPTAPSSPPSADPIVRHADVRRMLMVQRAWIEGGRAVTCWTALLIDRATRHPDRAQREGAQAAVALLTPVVKGFLSENAQLCTGLALQVHGGHGYVTETGIEQYVRDARITTIYEGTTGIQAADLLVRKLLKADASMLEAFVIVLREMVERGTVENGIHLRVERGATDSTDPDAVVDRWRTRHASLLQRLSQATDSIRRGQPHHPELADAVATDYLRLFGHAVMSTMWLRMATAASKLGSSRRDAKLDVARFYFERLLPEVESVLAVIASASGAEAETPLSSVGSTRA